MNIFIFTGPTISAVDAREWLDATYLPPVSQGDVASLLRFKPLAIGIIDGCFDSVPAVWHKEILYALTQGVHVFGAASMGALRAAEMHTFGMIGVGEIFEWYRDGVIDADDEVALQHAPAAYDYRPLSEPLVNIRKTLQAAHEAAVISSNTLEELLAIARRTLYWDRAYPHLLHHGAAAGLPAAEIKELRAFITENAIDLKRRDAIKLLRRLARLPQDAPPFEPAFELQETIFFTNLLGRDCTIAERDGVSLTIDELIDYLRLMPDFLDRKQRALVNNIVLDLARAHNLTVDSEEIVQARERLDLAGEEQAAEWRRRNDLNAAEFEQLLDELATIHKLRSIYACRVTNNALLRQLRIEGDYRQMVTAALNQKAQLAETLLRPVLPADLYDAYFADMEREVPEDLHEYAETLGYERFAQFLLALERRYAIGACTPTSTKNCR